MNDAEILNLVVKVTSTIILIEAIVLITVIIKIRKKLPRASMYPLVVTIIVSIFAGLFAISTAFNIMPLAIIPETISTVRSLIMLLMGIPIWIILAMYNVQCGDYPCNDCPVIKRIEK